MFVTFPYKYRKQQQKKGGVSLELKSIHLSKSKKSPGRVEPEFCLVLQ